MIYTSFYGNKHLPKDCLKFQISNSKPDWFNVNAKLDELVPPYNLVRDIKSGKITPGQYTNEYIKYLDSQEWDDILPVLYEIHNSKEIYVFLCWCSPNSFCHRKVLRDYLRERFNLIINEFK